ncbi:hypothetical protein ACDZ28_16475 [Paenibacillus sp. RS8]
MCVFLDECKAGGASVHPVKEGAWIAFNDMTLDIGWSVQYGMFGMSDC